MWRYCCSASLSRVTLFTCSATSVNVTYRSHNQRLSAAVVRIQPCAADRAARVQYNLIRRCSAPRE